MTPAGPNDRRGWLALGLALTVAKIWLTRGQVVCAVGASGPDLTFLQLADQLVKGNWLGPYGPHTLAQGPLYPLWIAAMFWLGVPLFLSQQVLYAGACALFTRACRPAVSRASFRSGLYALLLWNPASFDASSMSRVDSGHLSAPGVLALFAALLALRLRCAEPMKRLAPWAIAAGFSAAACWLTGEWIVWLIPGAGLLAAEGLRASWKTSPAARRNFSRALGLAGAFAVLPVFAVSWKNYRHYSRFTVTENLTTAAQAEAASVLGEAFKFADFAASFRGFSAYAPPSTGTSEELNFFRDLTRERISLPAGAASSAGATESALDGWKSGVLQQIGKILRAVLYALCLLAQAALLVRIPQALWKRKWSASLVVALATWVDCAAFVLGRALTHSAAPIDLSISSFAAISPLLLVFAAAGWWDAATAWRSSRLEAQQRPGQPEPLPVPMPIEAPCARLFTWLLGLGALAPFLLWHRQFAELFWFGDDYLLVDQIANMGIGSWIWRAFSENFVPLFKLLWGESILIFGGSYLAMLTLLWLTHAANTVCLGRLLSRAGFPLFAALLTQIAFALCAANIETLGWSVQWSAVLAVLFLLLGLLWHECRVAPGDSWRWRRHGPLVLFAAASACSFSRGVLTGPVLALALVLAAREANGMKGLRRSLPAALSCLAPAAVVAVLIVLFARGNQQHMSGHWGAAARFASGYFLLNPGWVLFGGHIWHPVTMIILGALKIGVLAGGLACASGRVRRLLLLLLVYSVADAILVGIGRYHTGIESVISSRYCYNSLLATLPFLGVLVARGLAGLPERLRPLTATALLTGLAAICLVGWPAELSAFLVPRGAPLRHLMAEPTTSVGVKVTVPSLDFMNVERAKALIRAYHLH